MTQPVHILDAKRDAGHGWKRLSSYRFAARDLLAPLLLAELQSALPYYAFAFVRRAPGEAFVLVALLGLHAQENLYVNQQGRWLAGYIPGVYRTYPFFLQPVAGEGGQPVSALAFNRDSGLYLENPGAAADEERFFEDHGQPMPLVSQVLKTLRENLHTRQLTDNAVNALAEADLLAPWPLAIDNPNPEQPLVQGLFRIDKSKLIALPGESLKSLNEIGALTIAYAQLFSMPRLAVLPFLYKHKQAAKPVSPAQVDLDKLFGTNDDILKFNF